MVDVSPVGVVVASGGVAALREQERLAIGGNVLNLRLVVPRQVHRIGAGAMHVDHRGGDGMRRQQYLSLVGNIFDTQVAGETRNGASAVFQGYSRERLVQALFGRSEPYLRTIGRPGEAARRIQPIGKYPSFSG